MSLLNEYISRKLSSKELQDELQKLISQYNNLRGTYLFVYSAAIGKAVQEVALLQKDYYVIHDILSRVEDIKKVDFYIETPGGSGETAEEIVKFLHDKFDTVSFVVGGEAKSAGTIIVLSGDEILMTETGSLGPIDAQMKIGRSIISAHDYVEWVKEKREEAQKEGRLNPFDATMVAQITPGELSGVTHALRFAEDLVTDWLVRYKFKLWETTESRGVTVTPEMKRRRAEEIARELTNHAKWRSHGRSIKINDLHQIGLRVTSIDNDPELSDIVYRIKTVSGLLFDSTAILKILATADTKIFRTGVAASNPVQINTKNIEQAKAEVICSKCQKKHNVSMTFVPNEKFYEDSISKGFTPFPSSGIIRCECGYEIDLRPIKNDLEQKTGRKIIPYSGDKAWTEKSQRKKRIRRKIKH